MITVNVKATNGDDLLVGVKEELKTLVSEFIEKTIKEINDTIISVSENRDKKEEDLESIISVIKKVEPPILLPALIELTKNIEKETCDYAFLAYKTCDVFNSVSTSMSKVPRS